MARSLNRVQLIGNLTRDPELRYTPTGAAVCTIGLATSRSWTTETGEKKEEAQFHRLIAWNKLAEICSQYLKKGSKIYVEGRIVYRKYTNKDNVEQNVTEIVIDDMIILDSKRGETGFEDLTPKPAAAKAAPKKTETPAEDIQATGDDVADDIPF